MLTILRNILWISFKENSHLVSKIKKNQQDRVRKTLVIKKRKNKIQKVILNDYIYIILKNLKKIKLYPFIYFCYILYINYICYIVNLYKLKLYTGLAFYIINF